MDTYMLSALSTDSGYRQEDLLKAMTDREGWWARDKGIHAAATADDNDVDE